MAAATPNIKLELRLTLLEGYNIGLYLQSNATLI